MPATMTKPAHSAVPGDDILDLRRATLQGFEREQRLIRQQEARETLAALNQHSAQVLEALGGILREAAQDPLSDWVSVAALDSRGILNRASNVSELACTVGNYDEPDFPPYPMEIRLSVFDEGRALLHPAYQKLWDAIERKGLQPTLHAEWVVSEHQDFGRDDHGYHLGSSSTLSYRFFLGAKFPGQQPE